MILIKIKNDLEPYQKFYSLFSEAQKNNQKAIDAVSISSFNIETNEVESRYVNLKYIFDEEWIFFSNYNSNKANNFDGHNQITSLIYWNEIDVQIRIKAKIKKSSREISDFHFSQRNDEKNALAISSNKSKKIASYKKIIEKYNETFKNKSLKERPQYWGGYSFFPYYFEFWRGNVNRINKRISYEFNGELWKANYLEP